MGFYLYVVDSTGLVPILRSKRTDAGAAEGHSGVRMFLMTRLYVVVVSAENEYLCLSVYVGGDGRDDSNWIRGFEYLLPGPA